MPMGIGAVTFENISPDFYAKDSWFTAAALQNETDTSALHYSPANASLNGPLRRYQFFDITVFAVEDLSQLPLNEQIDRRFYVDISYDDNGTNVNFSLPLDMKVTHIPGKASASHSVLSAVVACPSYPNCTSISAAQPLKDPIPALTKMTWTLSTRDKLGHPRDKSDEAKVTVGCKDEAGDETKGACILEGPHDEKDGNYTFVLTPLRTGVLTIVVEIGKETVLQASHMTFNVSRPICPAETTVLSEADADIRSPCVCATGTKRSLAGNTGSSQCELCPAGTFTLEQGAPECEVCPQEARCLGGAKVLNAAGFWLDLQCIANGIKDSTSISRKNVFDRDQCPFMKCPGGTTACAEPNHTSLFAHELSNLYLLLPGTLGNMQLTQVQCK